MEDIKLSILLVSNVVSELICKVLTLSPKCLLLNKIIVMGEPLYNTALPNLRTVEVQIVGDSRIEPQEFANNFICYSKRQRRSTVQCSLPNCVNSSPSKQVNKSRTSSPQKQQVTIHKVPGPIRKALKIGKFRKIFDFAHYHDYLVAQQTEVEEGCSIKVKRMSPRNERLTSEGVADKDGIFIDREANRTCLKSFSSKMSIMQTQYPTFKKKKLEFVDEQDGLEHSPSKYRNDIETKIQKEVNEIHKKHLVNFKKTSVRRIVAAEADIPKRFIGANFLSIEPWKPSGRKQDFIFAGKKSVIMPNIKVVTQLTKRSQSLDKNTLIPLEADCKIVTQLKLKPGSSLPPAHSRTCSDIIPKKQIIRNSKPFAPPFERYYYRDFMWKINFSHNVQVDVPLDYQKNFRVFIGSGNNRMLVKGLMKRRTWWTLTEKAEDCHFAWTQIKVAQIFRGQKKGGILYGEGNQSVCLTEPQIKTSDLNQKILNQVDLLDWKKYFSSHKHIQAKITQQMSVRKKYLKKVSPARVNSFQLRIHNHFQNNHVIGNKKAMFYTMSKYYELTQQNVFDYLPMTFHIESGLQDPTYMKFLNNYYEKAKTLKKMQKQQGFNPAKKLRNVWIVKPGEFTNRGTGITVCLTLDQVKNLIKTKQKHANGNPKTYIVQSYLDRPFLYCRRKFDIRHYMMITSINGIIRGYWYEEGYIRTTSFQFSLKTNTTGIHLTNDAIQKYLPEYGKYQKGNKLSYADFQKYLEKQHGKKYNFYTDVYPVMKKMATDAIKASFLSIDRQKREHNFQIFGMDFMIDENFHPWLIQINTNPCLELSCPLLGRIIPAMVQNALRIGLDPLFPPPVSIIQKTNYLHENLLETNRFELVFDETIDGPDLFRLYGNCKDKQQQIENISDDDEVYEDEGKQWEQGQQ